MDHANWKRLQFDKPENFIKEWKNTALELCTSNNPLLVGDTGSGKTVVALLSILKEQKTTLFLVPQKVLAKQHQNLLQAIHPEPPASQVITGEIKPSNREVLWNSENLVYFATPQTVINDLAKDRIGQKFELVFFDEAHRGRGDYAYTELAECFHHQDCKLIGLTASPGGTAKQILEVKDSLHLHKQVIIDVPTPEKLEDLVLAPVTPVLDRVSSLLENYLEELNRILFTEGFTWIEEAEIMTISDLKRLKQELGPDQFGVKSVHAEYWKLRHFYLEVMTNSYESALEYLQDLSEDSSKAAGRILIHPNCLQVKQILQEASAHPKILRLITLLASQWRMNNQSIIFVSSKSVGKVLVRHLNNGGVRAEVFFGGTNKAKKQQELIRKLESRELDAVVATSVAEEGLHLQSLDTVIHYSLPNTEISRMQRSGRAGRYKAANILFIALDHSIDKSFYWAIRNREKQMRKTIYEQSHAIESKSPTTQSLFPDQEEQSQQASLQGL